MSLSRPLATAPFFVFLLLACEASRGPVTPPDDGGHEGGDAKQEAASKCDVPTANTLSFDLTCQSACTLKKTHYAISVDKTAAGYPACLEGKDTSNVGHFQIPMLTGTDITTLRLDLSPYDGMPGTYPVDGTGDFFEVDLDAKCDLGDQLLTLRIPDTAPDAGLTPACTFKVKKDCADGPLHTVEGTFTCTFPSVGGGSSCTVSDGAFAFGGCTP